MFDHIFVYPLLLLVIFAVSLEKNKSIVNPFLIFSLLYFLIFVFRPIVIGIGIENARIPIYIKNHSAIIEKGAWLSFFFYLTSWLIYKLVRIKYCRLLFGVFYPKIQADVSIRKITRVSIWLLPLAIVIYLMAFREGGSFVMTIFILRTAIFKYSSILVMVTQLGALLGVILVIESKRRKLKSKKYVLIFLAFEAIILLTGDRSSFFIPIIFFIFAQHYLVKKIKKAYLISMILSVFLALGVMQEIRQSLLSDREIASKNDQSKVDKIVKNISKGANLDVYDYYLTILQYSENGNSRSGVDLYHYIVAPIPRFLWEGKPRVISEGVWFAEKFFGSENTGKPFTNVGLWFINFGMIGVILAAIFTGVLLKINLWYLKVQSNSFQFVYFLVSVFIICIGGFSMGFLLAFIKYLLPLNLIYRYARI